MNKTIRLTFPIRLTVLGNPPSQKNAKRAGLTKKGRMYTYSEPRVARYKGSIYAQLVSQRNKRGLRTISSPVVVWYTVYRKDERRQDLGNAVEALWDELQHSGIVLNDSLIVPRATGPALLDRVNPRVEIVMEPWDPEDSRRRRDPEPRYEYPSTIGEDF